MRAHLSRMPGNGLKFLFRLTLIGLLTLVFLIPQLLISRGRATRATHRTLEETLCDAVTVLPSPVNGSNAFTDITVPSGLSFTHFAGPPGSYFMPEVNGTGGALFDYDSDGDLDIFLVNSGRSPRAVGKFPSGARTESRLFRRESDGRYTDVTETAGVGDANLGVGCAVADVDNDGDLDLYLPRYGLDRLLENRGDGTFLDITEAAGIQNPDWGTGAVFFDYDGDGWLDLFVTNYVMDPLNDLSIACDFGRHRISYCGPKKFVSLSDRLFHNEGIATDAAGQGHVRFRDVSEESRIAGVKGAGLSAAVADFNRDGWPDVFVANDLDPNRLWINLGNGTFQDEAVLRGVATSGTGATQSNMGIAIGDINGDGALDLLCTHLTTEGATLFVNDGVGNFRDATREFRLLDPTFLHTGWGTAFVDLDHDGDLDLPIANGLVAPCQLLGPLGVMQRLMVRQDVIPDTDAYWRDFADRNLLLMNRGDGRFLDLSAAGGAFTSTLGSARGLMYGDVDQDGDLDLLVSYLGGRARLFRNDLPKSGHWLSIRAVDPRWKRDAYGAELTIWASSSRWFSVVNPAGSYAASHDTRVHFGLGDAEHYDRIEVRWPDGVLEAFPSGPTDRRLELRRGEGRAIPKRSA